VCLLWGEAPGNADPLVTGRQRKEPRYQGLNYPVPGLFDRLAPEWVPSRTGGVRASSWAMATTVEREASNQLQGRENGRTAMETVARCGQADLRCFLGWTGATAQPR